MESLRNFIGTICSFLVRRSGRHDRDTRGSSRTSSARNNRYTKEIVCLANSRKPPSGRCIAGREVTAAGFGNWIRPVSARSTQEISDKERRYKGSREPSVLDVISIEMTNPLPQRHQQENHLIDADCCWVKKATVGWQDLQPAVEDPAGPLWLNGFSSYNGRNDRVPERCVGSLSRSLYLIRPAQLRLVVASEAVEFGRPRRRVHARFNLCGNSYCIAVTDPWIESLYLAREEGEIAVDQALLCVSLGEMFHGYAYKLAAAVITPERGGA
jgi:hypothetical protein